ncbi:MAG: bifunctional phosphoribosylaminoimidazolecarboxamide formyltransferase/IMP cyclohydrolase, partial [Candidatus Aminicenantes bacterium]|nr:bifunctional phosphoribosylaminoimidazolecarboxamide formyltransferase/IMP cyclohydrolase [Candidatus Aminicenantes bacterium]
MSFEKRALISVYYKDGIDKIAAALYENGWEIISTGGTASYIEKNQIPVTRVSDITGFPEILGGRVKTLHPKIFGPILAKKSKEHLKELEQFSLSKIDLVIVNFYPFEEFLGKNAGFEDMVEKIDIGGPSMVRAAAKNFNDTIVIVKESDYPLVEEKVITEIISSPEKQELSSKAFSYTSYYDSLIANYLSKDKSFASEFLNIAGKKYLTPRYGENPHQKGAIYITDDKSPIRNLYQHHGKKLSYNNILDLSVVYDMINQFRNEKDNFSVVVKHQNPCGAALHKTQDKAFENALSGDPVSAFGGIVGFNHRVDW